MKNSRAGFTLIEFVMVIVITGIIFAFLAPMMKSGLDSYFSARERYDAVSELRLAADRMVREIRQAKTITSKDTTDFRFVSVKGESVRFWQNATDLKRNNYTMVANLDPANGLNFEYFPPTGTLSMVTVTIVVNTNAGNFSMQTLARIRNP